MKRIGSIFFKSYIMDSTTIKIWNAKRRGTSKLNRITSLIFFPGHFGSKIMYKIQQIQDTEVNFQRCSEDWPSICYQNQHYFQHRSSRKRFRQDSLVPPRTFKSLEHVQVSAWRFLLKLETRCGTKKPYTLNELGPKKHMWMKEVYIW